MKTKIAITILAAFAAGSVFLGITQAARLTQRINHLEGDIARLERRIEMSETKKKADSFRVSQVRQVSQLPAPARSTPNPPSATIPPGWQRREFNGLPYYVVPLADQSGRAAQLGSVK